MITLKMISRSSTLGAVIDSRCANFSVLGSGLCDIDIRRCDIEDIVRHTGPRRVNG